MAKTVIAAAALKSAEKHSEGVAALEAQSVDAALEMTLPGERITVDSEAGEPVALRRIAMHAAPETFGGEKRPAVYVADRTGPFGVAGRMQGRAADAALPRKRVDPAVFTACYSRIGGRLPVFARRQAGAAPPGAAAVCSCGARLHCHSARAFGSGIARTAVWRRFYAAGRRVVTVRQRTADGGAAAAGL